MHYQYAFFANLSSSPRCSSLQLAAASLKENDLFGRHGVDIPTLYLHQKVDKKRICKDAYRKTPASRRLSRAVCQQMIL